MPLAKMTGMKELQEALRQLDKKMANNVVRKSLRAGAKVTLEAIRGSAPRKTGRMAKAFAVTRGSVRKDRVIVNVQVAKKWFVGDLFYAGFVEFGWHVGKRSKDLIKHQARLRRGKKSLLTDSRRLVQGKHFVEAAASATAGAAISAIVETARTELEKAVAESSKG